MDYDEQSLNSIPTMAGPDGGRRGVKPVDEPSLNSAPTMYGGDPDALGRIDQYDLLRKLGGGGFGVVYLARDTVSGVEVALKTLHPLLKSNVEEMDALRAKFALISRLSHPNIASALVLHPVRDMNIRDDATRREMRLSPGDSVMVMRYAPGVTLSRWRRQFADGVVPLGQALEVARQIASALDYAHGERIVHRDIKPANVIVETLLPEVSQPRSNGQMVSSSDSPSAVHQPIGPSDHQTIRPPDHQTKIRVRILDFGLAAEIRSSMSRVSSETGDTSGTRPYMAPEQWLGRKQDGRTDQYALACVLYEMLSGAPPFAGVFETGDPAIMANAVANTAPEEIEGVPAHVNAALMRALAKDPKERFASCGEFVESCFKPQGTQGPPRGTHAEALRLGEHDAAKAEARNPKPGMPSAAPRRVWQWLLAGAAAVALGVGVCMPGGTGETGGTGGGSSVAVSPAAPLPAPTIDDEVRRAASPAAPLPAPTIDDEVRRAAEEAERKAKGEAERNAVHARDLRTVTLPNGFSIRLRGCPAGSFTMGSPATEDGREGDETQHRVTLTRGFWMGETEVTQGQWKSLMDEETVIGLARKALQDDTEYMLGRNKQTLRDFWGFSRDADPARICADPDDDVPVYHVSWNDAVQFCQRLTRRERAAGRIPDGYEYRLPTEAEWEYACRAGTTASLPNGREIRILGQNNAPALDDIAWYGGNSSVGFAGRGWDTGGWPEKQHPGGTAGPRKVRGKSPNEWGLYDMIGNVYEWCADWYGNYPSGAVTDPSGPSYGSDRVFRGGSWSDLARGCRSADRGRNGPGYRNSYLGFRVALAPVQ